MLGLIGMVIVCTIGCAITNSFENKEKQELEDRILRKINDAKKTSQEESDQ